MTALPKGFYLRRAEEVAPDLLGKVLCRSLGDGRAIRAAITETEAYCGEGDTAAHARFGRTPRTEVLYLAGGRAYVCRCRMWWLLNVSCGVEGDPQCVLIRGVEGADGPGRTAELMRVDRSLYGRELVPDSGVWIEDANLRPRYTARPRVGIGYASDADRGRRLNYRSVSHD